MKAHSFPPFKYNCRDYNGLIQYVREIIGKNKCLYCETEFGTLEAVQKHMIDVGHAKIDTENFGQFEQFYDWMIKEEENENDEN